MQLRVCVALALGFASALAQYDYIVPDAKLEALKPRGLRVSIPGMINLLNKITAFWVVTPCRASNSTETVINIYQITWFHPQETAS
jgi:hypothetical protein